MEHRKKVGISIIVGVIVLGFAFFAFASSQGVFKKSVIRIVSQYLDENQLLSNINNYRQGKKLEPVGLNTELKQSAQKAANAQLRGQYAGSREDIFSRMRSEGVFEKLGEVNSQSIGEFFLDGLSADDVMKNALSNPQLLTSIEHPCLKYIGIGQANDQTGHVAVIDLYLSNSCTNAAGQGVSAQPQTKAQTSTTIKVPTQATNQTQKQAPVCDTDLQNKQSRFYQSLLSEAIKLKADLDAAIESNKARLTDQSLLADSRKLFTDWLSADVEEQTKAQADIDNFRSALDSINQCKLFNDSIKNLDGAYGVHY